MPSVSRRQMLRFLGAGEALFGLELPERPPRLPPGQRSDDIFRKRRTERDVFRWPEEPHPDFTRGRRAGAAAFSPGSWNR